MLEVTTGIQYAKDRNKYKAIIHHEGKRIGCGEHYTKLEAALYYNHHAKKLGKDTNYLGITEELENLLYDIVSYKDNEIKRLSKRLTIIRDVIDGKTGV